MAEVILKMVIPCQESQTQKSKALCILITAPGQVFKRKNKLTMKMRYMKFKYQTKIATVLETVLTTSPM